MRLYIWGTGIKCKNVLAALDESRCTILGFIDNNPDKQGTTFLDQKIVAFKKIEKEFDYIVVSVQSYQSILYQIEEAHIDRKKVIVYFDKCDIDRHEELSFLNYNLWRIDYLEEKVERLERLLGHRIENLKYEVIDSWQRGLIQYPHIGSTQEAVKKITEERCSMIRFGDGEFEMMEGRHRAVFQKVETDLQYRLQDIIKSDYSQLLIAIANNYGNLEQYTQEVADGIRDYMTEETRLKHWKYLRTDKVYYDAYMFKCYYPYKDKRLTIKRVDLVKSIWDKRNVVIIEGDKTRTGYNNDLLENALSIKRVLCPTTNAFDKYNEILETAKTLSKEDLILTVLGPAGKVLSYDLFLEGYQVIDIGQIDMDYDWYKAGAQTRIPNSKKYISQLPVAEIEDIEDQDYKKQVLFDISK